MVSNSNFLVSKYDMTDQQISQNENWKKNARTWTSSTKTKKLQDDNLEYSE